MKTFKTIGALICAMLVMCSCSQNADSSSKEGSEAASSRAQSSSSVSGSESKSGLSEAEKEPEPVKNDGSCDVDGVGEGIAVVSIQTKDTGKDAIKFATEPVTEHVAKSRASWDWSYKVPAAPYYEECTVTVKDAEGSVLIDQADADVKVRGNWTTMYNKKPFRIKFASPELISSTAFFAHSSCVSASTMRNASAGTFIFCMISSSFARFPIRIESASPSFFATVTVSMT